MKKAIALLLALVMVFALCACGGGDKGTADNGEKVVKIGVFEPASGDSGAGGKKEMLGMQYANQETPTVEIGGETYKVELVYSDNGSDSAKAVSAASKLVNEKVSLVLGSYGSGVSIAASDTFKQAGIPAIGVTCTNPNVTAGNSHYFRIWIRSRALSLPTMLLPSSRPRRPTASARTATSMTRAWSPSSSRHLRRPAAPSSPTPSRRTTPTSAPT